MSLFSAMSGWSLWNYITALADIVILSCVIYKLLLLIKGTRAVQLLKGLLVLLFVFVISDLIGLHVVAWILEQAWAIIFIALVVIFQPELRRALERIGSGVPTVGAALLENGDFSRLIDEIARATVSMAKTKTGALIVLERNTGLSDYTETGVTLDANVSEQLLCNIFVKDTPLHDGATIISEGRVAAAACFLPLTDNPYISLELGTRHRSAIGLSEVSDALIIIVSEETGVISIAEEGKIIRGLDERKLRDVLASRLAKDSHDSEEHSSREGGLFHKRGGEQS